MEKDKISEKETHLIAPCGIYCGACDSYLGKGKKLATELYKILDGFNLIDVGSLILGVDQTKIKNFLKLLKKYGKSPQCNGCNGGGGNPMCGMKICTKEKGILTCAECDLMPCEPTDEDRENPLFSKAGMLELISTRYSNWNIENLRRIKEIGYRKFIDEMEKKVKDGFLTSDVISNKKVFSQAIKNLKKK
ncbi:MAG: DUF3795 domain-containing protein [Candidatus Helarchaeota archaeon]